MKGFECSGKWFGLRLGGNRVPLKFPGDSVDMIRGVLSEESSRQLSQNTLKRRKSEHGKADKQELCWQGPK